MYVRWHGWNNVTEIHRHGWNGGWIKEICCKPIFDEFVSQANTAIKYYERCQSPDMINMMMLCQQLKHKNYIRYVLSAGKSYWGRHIHHQRWLSLRYQWWDPLSYHAFAYKHTYHTTFHPSCLLPPFPCIYISFFLRHAKIPFALMLGDTIHLCVYIYVC